MSQANKKPRRKSKKEKELNQELDSMREELGKQEDELNTSAQKDIEQPVEETDDLIDSRLQENSAPVNLTPRPELSTKILNDDNDDNDDEKLEKSINIDASPEDEHLPASDSIILSEPTDLNSESLRAETIQPKYNEKPTVPRSAFQADSDQENFLEELNDRNKTLPLTDASSEDFIKEITRSLENDPYAARHAELSEDSFTVDGRNDDEEHDYLAEIESEIEKASQATNPFEEDSSDSSENDFLTRLKEIFPEDYANDAITKPLDDFEDLVDGESKLSSESWQEVLNATEESAQGPLTSDFLLQGPQSSDLEEELFSDSWTDRPDDVFSRNTLPAGEFPEAETASQDEDLELIEGTAPEHKESVDNLRRSFIEEFDQSTWPEEEPEPEKEESWLKQKSGTFSKWIKSLNGAEKALLIMSSIITLAVIVAIGLVLIRWQGNQNINGTPPEAIASVDPNLVYPTGLQLPGGWFFFLQRGELKNSKWTPQTAEWLVSSTVRRVVAIPWSRQAEAVAQTLKEGDEIRVFMNNNDIMNYYVAEVKQVERDNVDILTSNEPSLVVILFKTDNSDRWVIFANP